MLINLISVIKIKLLKLFLKGNELVKNIINKKKIGLNGSSITLLYINPVG